MEANKVTDSIPSSYKILRGEDYLVECVLPFTFG